jgi:tRNA(adenine34) deaminase
MSNFTDLDHSFMKRAFELANQAEQIGEIPIGAVLTFDDRIIGEGYNRSITDNDPTAHAEIVAIRQAAINNQNYRLPETTLYVTLEPCSMCAGAIVHSRIQRLVYGAKDEKTGACGSIFNVISTNDKNHRVLSEQGLMAEDAASLLSNFFKRRRAEIKSNKKFNK